MALGSLTASGTGEGVNCPQAIEVPERAMITHSANFLATCMLPISKLYLSRLQPILAQIKRLLQPFFASRYFSGDEAARTTQNAVLAAVSANRVNRPIRLGRHSN